MKKYKSALLLFLAVLVMMMCSCSKAHESVDVVATVNGESITQNEMDYFSGRLKSDVLNSYLQKYSVSYSAGFWDTTFDEGKTPQEDLDEQALAAAVKAKIQLVMMREQGIYSDISYEGLYQKAVEFNKENSGKQNVVGIESIHMDSFYTYYVDTGIMELKNKLSEKDLKPKDTDVTALAAEIMAKNEDKITDEEAVNIAKKQLIDEAYDKMVERLVDSAERSK